MEIINYGTISFQRNSPLGEIEDIICTIGSDMELLADTQQQYDKASFVAKLKEENEDISEREIKDRYEEHCQSLDSDCEFFSDKVFENTKLLFQKMTAYPQKDTLKVYLAERQKYYRDKEQKEAEPLYRKDAYYQQRASTEAKKTFASKVEKSKNA